MSLAACPGGGPPTERRSRADPLPLGKEVLLQMEAAASPWSPSLYALRGMRDVGERLVGGTLTVAEGLRLLEPEAVGRCDGAGSGSGQG